MGGNALYASLFEEGVARLDLHALPASHAQGPIYLNVMRALDVPQAVALAGAKSKVRLYTKEKNAWAWPERVMEKLAAREALELRDPAP